jgi:hypothetical protein
MTKRWLWCLICQKHLDPARLRIVRDTEEAIDAFDSTGRHHMFTRDGRFEPKPPDVMPAVKAYIAIWGTRE